MVGGCKINIDFALWAPCTVPVGLNSQRVDLSIPVGCKINHSNVKSVLISHIPTIDFTMAKAMRGGGGERGAPRAAPAPPPPQALWHTPSAGLTIPGARLTNPAPRSPPRGRQTGAGCFRCAGAPLRGRVAPPQGGAALPQGRGREELDFFVVPRLPPSGELLPPRGEAGRSWISSGCRDSPPWGSCSPSGGRELGLFVARS